MTATETALAALAAQLVHADLPAIRRDAIFDQALAPNLAGTAATAFILRRGTAQVTATFMGDGEGQFEIEHKAVLEWAVASADEALMQVIFDAGLAAIAARITAAPELGGAVSACVLEEAPEYDAMEFDNTSCIAAIIPVKLVFTSATPF